MTSKAAVRPEAKSSASPAARAKTKRPWTRVVRVLVQVVFLAVALWLFDRALRNYQLSDVLNELMKLSAGRIGGGCALAILAYLVLAGYDWLGFQYIRHPLPLRRITTAAFSSYAIGYNLGSSIVMGTSVRYRLYSAWGLSVQEIAKVVIFCMLTFWVGLAAIAGAIFLSEPVAIGEVLHLPPIAVQCLGALLVLLVAAYVAWSVVQKPPLRIRGWELAPPSVWIAVGQIAVTAIDLVMAGTVLYILLPKGLGVSYFGVIGAYLIAVIFGLASQVPGGLGVFEVAFFHLLPGDVSPVALTGALLAYRGVYYLLPLFIALLLLGGHELRIRMRAREPQRE